MDFIFRPLDAEGAKLRKQAQRLASTLPNAKGVANRIERGYILRAVGDGKTVVVTAIPPNGYLGAAPMAWLPTDAVYPGTTTREMFANTMVTLTHPSVKSAVFGGVASGNPPGYYADWRRYYSGGRALVGNVTQQWPLINYTPNRNDGWVRSPPEYDVPEGQCRFLAEGLVNSAPVTTQALVHRTGVLSLTCPLYRNEHYEGMSELATSRENAVTLVRMSARTPYIRVEDAPPDHPAAIKTDIQADPAVREGGVKGCGLIEFGYDVLGIELAPLVDDPDTVIYMNEGWAEPLGAVEWGPDEGVVCVRVIARDTANRLVFLRYKLNVSAGQVVGSVVWRSVFAGTSSRGPFGEFLAQGIHQQNTCGMWATRAGHGLSNGTPDQPDKLIVLSVYNASEIGAAMLRTVLHTVDISTGVISTNVLDEFDDDANNLSGPMLRKDYFFAHGATVGVGSTARPVLVCVRREVPYDIFPGVLEGEYYRAPIASGYSAGDEIGVSVINDDGSIIDVDLGANFPACYKPSEETDPGSPGDGKFRLLGLQVLRYLDETTGVAAYGQPIAEFAPGYIVALVTPIADVFTVWRSKLVVCNIVTGELVYESGFLAIPTATLMDFRGVSVARHGVVTVVDGVETVTDMGVLLVSLYKNPVIGAPAGGCFSTRDLGATLTLVTVDVPISTVYYIGDPLADYAIGGGQ